MRAPTASRRGACGSCFPAARWQASQPARCCSAAATSTASPSRSRPEREPGHPLQAKASRPGPRFGIVRAHAVAVPAQAVPGRGVPGCARVRRSGGAPGGRRGRCTAAGQRRLPGEAARDPRQQRCRARPRAHRRACRPSRARRHAGAAYLFRHPPAARAGRDWRRAATGAGTAARHPQVEYAELNERRYPLALPNDSLFDQQWVLQSAQPAAIDAVSAWNVTTGSPGLVIADLDTGVRFDHPDLRNAQANRLLPGYNLIANVAMANNGYGRGPDASDPGDWISASDLKNAQFTGCQIANSSWHGTRVSGILGAITNNGAGIAGTTWEGWIEPVRVLGKCGGYDSDIIAGMAWAAGDQVTGVPDNPYPARIINMSLGATGPCPASYQQMVDELLAQGVLIVVSAGNEGGPVDAPANCIGAVGVVGVRQVGTKVGYSSLGPEIALAAPAGNCVNSAAGEPCLFSIETTTNSGTTVPATNTYTDEYNYNVGTSFSAPLVSGIAGLMLAVNGNLTPPQLIGRLQLGVSTPFPAPAGLQVCHLPAGPTDLQTSECACTPEVCGSGMANAQGAVLQALRPIAAVALPAKVSAG